jgi:hypothetical protein
MYTYRQTSSGFITESLLLEYIKEDFIPACNFQRRKEEDKNKPILVLCDGHSSRFSPQIWKIFKENNIMLYCIPSHSSHIFQVLDLMPNASVKKQIQNIKPIKKHCGEEEIIRFLGEVEKAVSKGLSKDVIDHGFNLFFISLNIYTTIK